MQRIAIIGCGGSGKSTLARELGAVLGLPVHHLDQLYWHPGWVETAPTQWRALQQQLCSQPAWIMDGNYGGTLDLRLAAADAVVFLDLPTRVCLWGAVRRFLQHRGRSRPDMAVDCPERLDAQYLWWVCNYRRTRRSGILRRLQQLSREKRVVILQSRRAVAEFLRSPGAAVGARQESPRPMPRAP